VKFKEMDKRYAGRPYLTLAEAQNKWPFILVNTMYED
jgi:hypothetical protein